MKKTSTKRTPDIGNRCALYLRASTDRQHTENQRPDVVQLAHSRGFEIVAIFEENVSATKKRTAFEAMRLAAHRGEFDILIVWSLDRLGRTMVGNLNIVTALDEIGVRVISVKEPWLDTGVGNPVRGLLLGIFSWIAEQERRRISERTRAGLERARRRGARIGRPKAYLTDLELRQALELREQGLGVRKIAQRMKRQIGASTLHRLLQEHEALEAAKRVRPENGYAEAAAEVVDLADAA